MSHDLTNTLNALNAATDRIIQDRDKYASLLSAKHGGVFFAWTEAAEKVAGNNPNANVAQVLKAWWQLSEENRLTVINDPLRGLLVKPK